jgi:hypothetical protein
MQTSNHKIPVFDVAHLIIMARNAINAKRPALGVKKKDTKKKCVGLRKQMYQRPFMWLMTVPKSMLIL